MRVVMTFSQDELINILERAICKEYFDGRRLKILNRDGIIDLDSIYLDLEEEESRQPLREPIFGER